MSVFHKILRFLEAVFDILFPKSELVRRLEEMSAREMRSVVAQAQITGALFSYQDPLARQIVWEIKYRGDRKIVRTVGEILCEEILRVCGGGVFAAVTSASSTPAASVSAFATSVPGVFVPASAALAPAALSPASAPTKNFLIIPIPASRRRRRWRGFNQTELLARAILECANSRATLPSQTPARTNFFYCPDILIKIRETPAQTSLRDRSARLSNLHDAFAIKDSASADFLRGKIIILIDDVITTGATMREALRVLGTQNLSQDSRDKCGPRAIFCFAIAH